VVYYCVLADFKRLKHFAAKDAKNAKKYFIFSVIARCARNDQLLILFFFAPFASFAAKNSFF